MYAVIKTGGKQYKVAAGEKLKIEQIPALSLRIKPARTMSLCETTSASEGASFSVARND